ncbi:ribosome biogenesis protein YTM1, putative [Hepatocystis sp. ex Piliocolobus tephrosceles]|nr:ribosome biogenesis protein YTM1, putative [Hepatocystis sp. ex Piliocolobus tephrosceles]
MTQFMDMNKKKKKKKKTLNNISSSDDNVSELMSDSDVDEIGSEKNDEYNEQHNSDNDALMYEDSSSKNGDKQVQIIFTTKITDAGYKVDDSTYTVPTKFKRIDLSIMVKQLLNIVDSNVSFDFLINNKILRTSIKDFLENNNMFSEDVIEIEYIKSITKKKTNKIDDTTKWISNLIILDDKLYCSSFQGTLLYYDLNKFKKINENIVTSMTLFAYNICKNNKLNNYINNGSNSGSNSGNNSDSNSDKISYHESAIGLSNGTLKVFLYKENNNNGEIKKENELYLGSHNDMIKAIEFNKSGSLLISSGADEKINIYDNTYIIEQFFHMNSINKNISDNIGDSSSSNVKRSNNNKRKIQNIIMPKKCINTEVGIITNLKFFNDNNKFVCTGLGNNINIYDILDCNISSTFAYKKSIMCVDIINDNLFIVADEQSIIKLLDIRCMNNQNNISLNEKKYYFHDKIITSIKANKNETYFLSASHDGYINIYDIRLNKLPVYTIENEKKPKILDATWFYNKNYQHSIISADEYNLNVHNF